MDTSKEVFPFWIWLLCVLLLAIIKPAWVIVPIIGMIVFIVAASLILNLIVLLISPFIKSRNTDNEYNAERFLIRKSQFIYKPPRTFDESVDLEREDGKFLGQMGCCVVTQSSEYFMEFENTFEIWLFDMYSQENLFVWVTSDSVEYVRKANPNADVFRLEENLQVELQSEKIVLYALFKGLEFDTYPNNLRRMMIEIQVWGKKALNNAR